jgi:diguanylate cyclase (GGDEF)-like protein
MNIRATHGFTIGGSRKSDDDRVTGMVAEGGVLAPVAATAREKHVAFVVVFLSILALAAILPFARVPLPKLAAFIPSYESALAINDLVTALLLFGQINRRRSRAFLALACGYLFNAAIIILHALSFPGVFSATGLLGATDQTTSWLFVFWHGGFPLFVLGYALLPVQDRASDYLHRRSGKMILFSIIGVVAAVTGLTLLATVGHSLLPRIIENGNYTLMVSTGVSPMLMVLSAAALFALWRRPERAAIDVWLMVVMSAWLLDLTLSAVVSSSRYDLGWYVGRSYGFLAACCLLVVLLDELNQLYRRLTDALSVAQTLEEHLTYRAENDSLTGLPNRALFYDRLETAIARCQRSKKLMALLYLDIDSFKTINDNLGHAAGDDLLRSFGRRLLQCVRASDTAARLGGDEFTIILENLASREAAQGFIDKLMIALRRPYGADDIHATASVGIVYFTGGEIKADGLLKRADAALYRAKHRGRNGYCIHVPGNGSDPAALPLHDAPAPLAVALPA